MNSCLVNNKAEYYQLMRQHYWNNPDFTDEKADKSWVSRPEKYPCVVVHTWHTEYSGRISEAVEFVYLEHFGLQRCEKCERLCEDKDIEWRCDEHYTWMWLCENCKFEEVS